MELAMNQGCTSYNKGERRQYQYSNYICDPDSSVAFRAISFGDSVWIADRDSSGWSFDFNHIQIGSIQDSRDGNVYKTVGVKDQLWMVENLNYNKSGSYCYHDSTKYCKEYGRLYKWNNLKDVCPKGWHVPSEIEANTLISQPYFGDYDISGDYLYNVYKAYKICCAWYGREESSFNGHTTINWINADYYWTSNEFDNEEGIYWGTDRRIGFSTTSKNTALPVRCIKD